MWCNAGDPVCAVGSEPVNITAHWSYYEEYTEVAARWIVATALGDTEVRLDLDLDGQDESVVLTESRSLTNGSGSRGGDGSEGLGLRNTPGGGLGVLGLVVLVSTNILFSI